MDNKVIAERLKALRAEKGVSQAEIAKFLDVDRTTYTSYESGKSRPVRYMDKLASYFNVSSDYLIGMTDSPLPKEILFNNLSDTEKVLLINYWKLNKAGKEKAAGYISDLTKIAEYTEKEKIISA